MSVYQIVDLIESSTDITLSNLGGKIHRVYNSHVSNAITVTFGSDTSAIAAGKFQDFWYNGTEWYSFMENNALGTTAVKNEDKKGFQFYTEKFTGIITDLNKGILRHTPGYAKINGSDVYKESDSIVSIASDLTPGRWYVVYSDNSGAITLEVTTATDYTQYPIAALNVAAPLEAKGLSRYKTGDSNKRAVSLVYVVATQTAWNSGTTYVRGQRCLYNGLIYISKQGSNLNQNPATQTNYWGEMGTANRVFEPKVYNLPESIFGTGALGDVTLDGTGLGATATPFYGVRENVTGTIEYYPEYEFNNLTINGVCYCGKSDGLSLDPVVIRVKGTLTIGASGQLNGNSRGANGGAGGTAGQSYTISWFNTGGAGGAGAKSGRPIHIYANKIVDLRTSGYWLTSQAGNPSNGGNGGNGSGGYNGPGGGGGAGGSSSSEIKIITNSILNDFIIRFNKNMWSATPALRGVGGNPEGTSENGTYRGLDGIDSISANDIKGGTGGSAGTSSANMFQGGCGGQGGHIGCGGGGGGGGGGSTNGTSPWVAGSAGGTGSVPALPHEKLGLFLIIDRYDSREAI